MQGQNERQRVVADLADAVRRNVAHGDAGGAGGDDVNVVVGDAVADDHLAALHGLDHLFVHRHVLHQRAVRAGGLGHELAGVAGPGLDDLDLAQALQHLLLGLDVRVLLVVDDDLHGGPRGSFRIYGVENPPPRLETRL